MQNQIKTLGRFSNKNRYGDSNSKIERKDKKKDIDWDSIKIPGHQQVKAVNEVCKLESNPIRTKYCTKDFSHQRQEGNATKYSDSDFNIFKRTF